MSDEQIIQQHKFSEDAASSWMIKIRVQIWQQRRRDIKILCYDFSSGDLKEQRLTERCCQKVLPILMGRFFFNSCIQNRDLTSHYSKMREFPICIYLYSDKCEKYFNQTTDFTSMTNDYKLKPNIENKKQPSSKTTSCL